jgi:predicted ATP-dependent protease
MRQAPPRTLALTPDQLYRACDPASLGFDTTASIAPMPLPFAQPRAARAIELAIGMQRAGYNVFVMGAPGAGKRALVTGLIEALPHPATAPPDWVYLNNFAAPHKPLAVSLPAGQGRLLAHDMAQLVEELQSAIPALFESDEYRSRAAQIESEFTERHERAFSELGEEAGAQSIGLLRTPAGFSFAPLKNGEVIAAGDYAALPEAEKARLQGLIEGLQRKLEAIIRKMLDWRRELRQRVKQLNGEMTLLAVGHFVDELKQRYAHVAKLAAYFDAVQRDVIDNADDFRGAASPAAGPPALHPEQPSFHRYAVNVMVDHGAPNGAPAVLEELPTYPNLVGRVDHASQFGTLVTDFTLVKPGALHRANGGCLMLDARRLLMQPYAWEGLKRALRTSAIRIESLAEMYSLLSTASLEPEPIPLAVKVVLFGERELYYMLSACDPEFPELFKIVADFDDRYDRSPENVASYARMLASITQRGGLLPLESAAAARVVDHGARSASDSKKLDANIRAVSDLLCEADQYARAASRAAVSREDIERAIAARRARADRFHNRLHEAIVRGTLMIATSGERVGQVNGLSVYELGGQAFAEPTRITATTRLGDGKVIDVQREVELGGAIHSKGVLILSSFLAARYSQNQQHALSASLVFEQTYGVVDGDSASLAELCALISSLADVPIRQSLALTGSVNQLGEVQAIGAVNEKIEGYFELCSARGLDGRHGVIIPATNVEHLMLDAPVVDAVRSGLFAVYAVKSVDEAIELLTGMPAGVTDNAGAFPPDTVNGRVTRRLRMLSEARASQVRIAVTGMNHGRQRWS